jgi:hypothetical protein
VSIGVVIGSWLVWWRGSGAIARFLIYRSDEVAGRRGVHMQPPEQAACSLSTLSHE